MLINAHIMQLMFVGGVAFCECSCTCTYAVIVNNINTFSLTFNF